MSEKVEWFESWFNSHYQLLYPHRDDKQAAQQVDFVLKAVDYLNPQKILDVACGEGRHLLALREKSEKEGNHVNIWGMDLSKTLLKKANQQGVPVMRADMRALPFKKESFDLMTCFFSSFGYFATEEEDIKSLGCLASLLKREGVLFLDLVNKNPLIKKLVPMDKKNVGGFTVTQTRKVEGDRVLKKIVMEKEGESETYEEKLRLYSLDKIKRIGEELSLEWMATFGDEKGAEYHEGNSLRMSLLFRKKT